MPLNALKQWFSDTQKEVYVLGPLLPSDIGTQNGEDGAGVDFENFLGEILEQHGKGSVFFVRFGVLSFFVAFQLNKFLFQISFGTTFYPTVPEYVDELIEALIEKKAPFVSDSCFTHDIL